MKRLFRLRVQFEKQNCYEVKNYEVKYEAEYQNSRCMYLRHHFVHHFSIFLSIYHEIFSASSEYMKNLCDLINAMSVSGANSLIVADIYSV